MADAAAPSAPPSPAAAPGPETSAPPAAPAGNGPAATASSAAPAAAAADRRVHVYEAAATQRQRVMTSFNAQRAAILKAVADQRTAALAPILAVQTKMAGPNAGAGLSNNQEARASGSPGTAATFGPGSRLQGQLTPHQLVAADIVVAFKSMIADEVCAQLDARLKMGAPSPGAPPRPAPTNEATRMAAATQPTISAALVATLKAMVAEEVAAQLDALRAATTAASADPR